MSAGICIMNKQAIAMAADSAVTIGDHAAIHNSANKLFSLSRVAPVGLIIYSNATLMSVPVEIIVKEYKKQLKDKTFQTLREYVDDFIKYIESNAKLFRLEINEKNYVTSVFCDFMIGLLGDYKNLLDKKCDSKKIPLTEEEKELIRDEVFAQNIEFINKMTKRPDYSYAKYVEDKYSKHFAELLRNDNGFKWLLDNQVNELAVKVCDIFDTNFDRNGYVGIALAGYGDSEIYPHMIHIRVSGFINGKLRYQIVENVEIKEDNSASVTPLAQTDVMQTFLFGINDRFLSDLSNELPAQIKNNIDSIDDNMFASGKKDEVRAQISTITTSVLKHVNEVAVHDYMRPIIESVATLPIEELALLAESMINITSLRRKVALDRNIGTVGGPIDVAIISKGDGFIWLKRKHYFERKYNPQYFYSHFDKTERGDDDE